MNRWITSLKNMTVLIWSKARYTCGLSKSNSASNVIGLVIWALAFSWRMRKSSIFLYMKYNLFMWIWVFHMSFTKSLFSWKLRIFFIIIFRQCFGDIGRCRENVVGGSSNIYFKAWVSKTHYIYSGSIFGLAKRKVLPTDGRLMTCMERIGRLKRAQLREVTSS